MENAANLDQALLSMTESLFAMIEHQLPGASLEPYAHMARVWVHERSLQSPPDYVGWTADGFVGKITLLIFGGSSSN